MEGERGRRRDDHQIVYVAVSEEMTESWLTVDWAINHSGDRQIGILHVRTTARERGKEKKKKRREGMFRVLEDHLKPFTKNGENVPMLVFNADSIADGIVQLIDRENVGILVMRSATIDSQNHEGMSPLQSKNLAHHVMTNAPDTCQMWVVCEDNLIRTRYPERVQPANPSHERVRTRVSPKTSPRFKNLTPTNRSPPPKRSNGSSPASNSRRIPNTGIGGSHPDHFSGNEQYLYNKIDELEEEVDTLSGKVDSESKKHREAEKKTDVATRKNEEYQKQLDTLKIKLRNCLGKKLADFSYSEIKEATNNLSPSRKIGEGGFGITYKGHLHHTEVAIKVLSSDSLQGPPEFKQEADTLSRLRHPNIVTLIGICSEASALIYEYLPNGSLEDQLCCKNNTPPLTWQTRICIATELCSALMFMHSCQPKRIIHGDLKPSNVLLDSRLSCKLSNFGISRAVDINMTMAYRTDPKGTFAYMDPEFMSTGILTPKSDVYSFGIILLQLLTRRSPLGIIQEVLNALDNNNLKAILDPSAKDWPYVQANQLAHLGLRCSQMQRHIRPDLEADAWKVLEAMRISVGSSPLANRNLDESEYIPPYFMCPIFQDVMKDPQIAADGYTYDKEAIIGWLDTGRDTSPITNLRLANKTLDGHNSRGGARGKELLRIFYSSN